MIKKVMIIAEAGVNHNGSVALAELLIDKAADSGADFVKFQSFTAKRLVTQDAPKADYQKKITNASETQYEMLRRLELSRADHITLINKCRARNIGFLSTAFDQQSFDMLMQFDLEYVKLSSGDLTDLPLLRHISNLGKRVILSTGMATLEEVEAAILAIEDAGTPRGLITLLHCTTEYPAPMKEVNLRAMISMKHAFGVDVGYSDHTSGIEVSIAAVAMGATIIEKHFTLDRSLPGPDHEASLEPDELSKMVCAIRNIEIALGDGVKQPSQSELKNRLVVRKSIVATKRIHPGELLTSQNLGVKRPGNGISPMRWNEVLGSVALRSFDIDQQIEI